MHRRTARRLMALAATSLGVLAAPAPVAAVTAPPTAPGAKRGAGFVDVRTDARRTAGPAATRRARTSRAGLRRSLGRQGVLALDPLTGTPRALLRLDGALSGPAAGDRETIARRYLRANAAALGLSAAEVEGLSPARAVAGGGGLVVQRYTQSYRGIPAFDNDVRVGLDRAGRVITVTGSPRPDLEVASTSPRIGGAAALRAVMDSVEARRPVAAVGRPEGPRRTTRLSTGDTAKLVLFGARDVRLAWHVTYQADSTAYYDAVVDAETGALLYRQNLVKFAAEARVWRRYPGSGAGGTQETVDLQAEGFLPAGATKLDGRFAHTFSDVDDDDVAAPTEEVGRSGGTDFSYDFTPFTHAAGGCTAAKLCGWDAADRTSWQTNRKQNAVQVHWYVSNFHDHLAAAPIGFGPESGNFEAADKVEAHTDDGAATAPDGGPDSRHLNNANMLTLPDGTSPTMQMYLFADRREEPRLRDINGGDDAAILYHEYTHGLSSRLITRADGVAALSSAQGGALGEAWSDWYAEDYLNRVGLAPDDPGTDGEVHLGEYTDRSPGVIRTQALDCRVGSPSAGCQGFTAAGPGGYTYGDFGRVVGRPEVHADGEIWAQTLWDLRQALVAAGGSTAAGSDTAEALITGGMRLSPPEPSFIDARNAILAADTALFGGANRGTIWSTFAARGMGFFADAVDGSDVKPVESFSPPPPEGGPAGSVRGIFTDADTGLPLAGAQVGFGGHLAAGAPGALVTATAPDGRYLLEGVPAGDYPRLVATAPGGFDPATRPNFKVPAGEAVTADLVSRRDWAGSAAGAVVAAATDNSSAGAGCGVSALIDQRLGTVWSTINRASGGVPPGTPPASVTVELPEAIDVTEFALDPAHGCGDDPSSATEGYRVETSADGVEFEPALEGTFAPQDAGRLNLRKPSANATGVKFVRLTLLSPQSAAPGGSGARYIDFAELEVYGAPPNVLPSGSLSVSPAEAAAGTPVTLDARSFTDPDSAITGYRWDFEGDGTVDRETAEPTTAFAYAVAGEYAPRVAARDFRGGEGVATAAVSVAPAPAPDTGGPGLSPSSPPGVEPPATVPPSTVPAARPRARRVRLSARKARSVRVAYTAAGATRARIRVVAGGRTIATRVFKITRAGRRSATLRFKRRVPRRARVTVEIRLAGPGGIVKVTRRYRR